MGLLRGVMTPLTGLLYNCRFEKFSKEGQYLILFNHQTPLDQFIVSAVFPGSIYYVATEDIFSNGIISSLLRHAVAPIPIKKATTDISAVRNCLRVAKEGGTIAIAPEGNRTYSGKTGYINPAIASLAKKMKLPIALMRIEGGYGVEPRWASNIRRGKMKAYVSEVLTPEQYADMSADEIYEFIKNGLFVDESRIPGEYKSSKNAESIERAMFVCPDCGLSTFSSEGSVAWCNTCQKKISYGNDKKLKGIGFEFPYKYVGEWYEGQCGFVNRLDLLKFVKKPLFTDCADLSEVIVYKKKQPVKRAAVIRLYGDRITVMENSEAPMEFDFKDITAVTAMGRNKLNINLHEKIYQFKGDKSFNPLKYVNFYYRFNNIAGGNGNAEFLGL